MNSPFSFRQQLLIRAAIVVLLCLAILWYVQNRVVITSPTRRFSAPEALVPTPQAGLDPVEDIEQRPPFPIAAVPTAEPATLRWRVGAGVPDGNPQLFNWAEVRPGWYLNWTVNLEYEMRFGGLWTSVWMRQDDAALGMEFVPMVRVYNGHNWPNEKVLYKLARANRGRTWLIGNEPDVKWQDDCTPEEYVAAYYAAYHAIKRADPGAQVAFAGLSQITPLRLRYLDRVWELYQQKYGEEMPVDLWNMHAFVLREEANQWGVEIPPGFPDVKQGELWDVADHNNLQLIEGQIRRMRQWMIDHGQREKPLWITEYGILMPPSYGFPPSVVNQFIEDSFDLFNSLTDPALGYSADGQRLVQRWTWFSTNDRLYPTPNLFNGRGRANPALRAMMRYLEGN